jgi:hypothetical protein
VKVEFTPIFDCQVVKLTSTMTPELLYPQQWKEYLRRKQKMDEMTLERFLAEWQVSREELAIICECSLVTVNHWFSEGSSHREPNLHHRRRLADAHRELLRMKHESSRFRQIYNNIHNRP